MMNFNSRRPCECTPTITTALNVSPIQETASPRRSSFAMKYMASRAGRKVRTMMKTEIGMTPTS